MEATIGVFTIIILCSFLASTYAYNQAEHEPEYLQNLFETGQHKKLANLLCADTTIITYNHEQRAKQVKTELFDFHYNDMLLRPWQIDQNQSAVHFNGLLGSRWDGYVPYFIASTNYTEDQLKKVKLNIANWNARFRSCIEFRERTDETDYVFIFNGNAVFSNVGHVGGVQVISLTPEYGMEVGFQHHEMMHTVGFVHEHLRLDRDEYIKVDYSDPIPGKTNQYDIVLKDPKIARNYPDYQFIRLLGPFDYYSNMMIPIYHNDGSSALTVLRPGVDESQMGHFLGLSKLDEQKITNMYC